MAKRTMIAHPNGKPTKNVHKTIDSLSEDELFIIFGYLDLKNQLNARKVCRRWRRIIGYAFSRWQSLSLVNNTENVVNWAYESWFEVVPHSKQFTRVEFKCLNTSLKTLLPLYPNLKDLDFECYDVNTQTVRVLAQKCPNLERINLDSCNGFNVHIFKCLAKDFKRLRILNLSCVCKVTDTMLARVLESVTQLVALNVCGTDITGQCLTKLNKNLMHLNISYCWHLEASGLTALTQSGADNLQELVINNFQFDSQSANTCLSGICSKFSKLQRLDMRLGQCVERTFSINTLNYEGLSTISRLTQLKTLLIRKICVMDDLSLREILFRCPLEQLELDMFPQTSITDSSVSFLPHCHQMRVLELSNNQHISGVMLTQVLRQLTKLSQIILRFTNVTNDAIIGAITHCPDLRYVCLNGCANITRDSLLAFFKKAKANPHLKYEFIAIKSGVGSPGIATRSKARLKEIPANIEFKVSTGRTRQFLWFESGKFFYSRVPDQL